MTADLATMRALLSQQIIADQQRQARKPYQQFLLYRQQRLASALDTAGESALLDQIQGCKRPRSPVCGSLYCPKCYSFFRDAQQKLVDRNIINKHSSVADLHKNLRSLTILHSVIPLDQYHQIDLKLLRSDIRKHRRKFETLAKRTFPSISMVGAFEFEIHDQINNLQMPRKQATVIDLPNASFFWPSRHILIFHSHLLVDLNGTSDANFIAACKRRWPSKNAVLVKRLTNNQQKPISKSIQHIVRYPFKAQFSYPDPNRDNPDLWESLPDGYSIPDQNKRPIDDLPLATLISTYQSLGVKGLRIIHTR